MSTKSEFIERSGRFDSPSDVLDGISRDRDQPADPLATCFESDPQRRSAAAP